MVYAIASSVRQTALKSTNWSLHHQKTLARSISIYPPASSSSMNDDESKDSMTNSGKHYEGCSTAQTKMVPSIGTSMIGMGRVFIAGSGIGSDTSMISSNDRWTPKRVLGVRHFSASQGQNNDEDHDDAMDDEYGEMTSDGIAYVHPTPFQLENGEYLHEATVNYKTYGTLNENRDNVIVVCHALTGNASLHSWWGGLLGDGLAFDTSKYFIVCANILGSCYGSTSPMSPNPSDPDKKPYLNSFPDISVRDTVRIQLHMLQKDLQIKSIKSVIGGSFGGTQTLEFDVLAGSDDSEFTSEDGKPFIRSAIPIACGAAHTAWQIAISETQRQAIYADPKWNNGNVDPNDQPVSGLAVARQIGMVSYRTALGYEQKFGREVQDGSAPYGSKAQWQVKSYLEYQGEKFLSRFDPVTYVKLTEQLDTHDVGRNRGGKEKALSTVNIPNLILGIDSDVLYPIGEQEELKKLLPNSELKIIRSDAGHDGFLLEQDQVGKHIIDFLNKIE